MIVGKQKSRGITNINMVEKPKHLLIFQYFPGLLLNSSIFKAWNSYCQIPVYSRFSRMCTNPVMLCISRILPGRDIFSLDIKIYLYLNICDHSVAESKSRDLVIVFILLQGHSGT